MVVRELLTQLGFRVDQGGINIYQTTINNISNSANQAAQSVQDFFAAFVSFSALSAMAKTADEMQSLEARIGMLPQTVGTAADAFDAVATKASAAKQSIDAYASFYIKAANATQDYIKDQKGVLDVVDAVAFGLAASGSTAVAQSQAFFQLGQAIGSPAVQMEEMNTLIDVAPDLFRALGKAIPGANGNLKAFIGTGKVTGQMLAEGLVKVMPQFTEQMKAMPMTVGTATTIVGNRWAVFLNRINRESMAITFISNLFLAGFDRIQTGLDEMVKFFGGATNTVKFFGIALIAAFAPTVFNRIVGLLTFLRSPLGILIGLLLLVGIAIDDFYKWMQGGDSVFGSWLGNFDDAKKKFLEYEKTIIALKIAVVSAVSLMIIHFIELAVTSIATAAQAAFAWVTSLAQFSAAVVRNGFIVARWVVMMVARIAFMSASWVASMVTMAASTLAATWPILAIVAAVAAVIAILYVLYDNWKLVMKFLQDVATLNFKGISDDFSAMVDRLKGYWSSFKSFFGMGASTSITASTVAGAAAAAGGVGGAGSAPVNITVNQELPPGTPQETANAARDATMQAAPDSFSALSRKMGQAL